MDNDLIPVYESKMNAITAPPLTITRSEAQKKAGTPALKVDGVDVNKLSKVAFIVSVLSLAFSIFVACKVLGW